MGQYERLVMMAEDELTEYSSDARKIEKLRRKIGLSVPIAQQREVKQQLIEEIRGKRWIEILIDQRQAAALPFWGIAGLGMLLGISMAQPLDIIPAVAGVAGAIAIQRLGWKLYAKKLVLDTLEEIEAAIAKPD
jgi:hypothetical protein